MANIISIIVLDYYFKIITRILYLYHGSLSLTLTYNAINSSLQDYDLDLNPPKGFDLRIRSHMYLFVWTRRPSTNKL